MQFVIDEIVGAIVNVIVFAAIPFIWWLVKHRKETNFFKWIGLYTPQLKSKWWVLILFAIIYYASYKFDYSMFVSEESMNALENSESVATNAYTGLGMAAIIPGFFSNFIGNGLAEEILFRGFINKRFCAKLGKVPGILTQAVLFALMHNVLYVVAGIPVGMDFHLAMFISTSIGALLLAWLNEKIFNESIIPSVLLHGAGNFWATIRVAFSI